jgi:Cellulose-binding Sde182, nucleoside hydrolase-like domain
MQDRKRNMTTLNTIKLAILVLSGLAAIGALAEDRNSRQPDRTAAASGGALAGDRYRVLVSTDIGGTDPDDFQSMVHLLVYSDSFDIEGLVSSAFGLGRKEDILNVVDCYAKDYANLRTYSDKYPTPDALRAITKQGEKARAPYAGVRQSTEGSEWIVQCARRDDPRPLHVLVWGGIEDLAQALHDAPDILPKLRVYWIGGPNKKWSPDAYQYITDHHPKLWIIESNATYRGWFTGGNQSGDWSNSGFVAKHVAGKGALGDYFNTHLGGRIKMGDTPSVGWLLLGNPADPTQPGWGGKFVHAWERPHVVFNRLTTATDRIEQFGVFELVLPVGGAAPTSPEASMQIENQSLAGDFGAEGSVRFRFSPKGAKTYSYRIRSNVPALDGNTGRLTSFLPPPASAQRPSRQLPNWWTDDPSPEVAEGPHIGAKTVSQWREGFLRDFAARMLRCTSPASPKRVNSTKDSAP